MISRRAESELLVLGIDQQNGIERLQVAYLSVQVDDSVAHLLHCPTMSIQLVVHLTSLCLLQPVLLLASPSSSSSCWVFVYCADVIGDVTGGADRCASRRRRMTRAPARTQCIATRTHGATENARPENAGLENDGPC